MLGSVVNITLTLKVVGDLDHDRGEHVNHLPRVVAATIQRARTHLFYRVLVTELTDARYM